MWTASGLAAFCSGSPAGSDTLRAPDQPAVAAGVASPEQSFAGTAKSEEEASVSAASSSAGSILGGSSGGSGVRDTAAAAVKAGVTVPQSLTSETVGARTQGEVAAVKLAGAWGVVALSDGSGGAYCRQR